MPNKYQFILFCGLNELSSKFEPQTGYETGYEMGCETGHLFKRNQTKPKTNKEKTVFGEFGQVWLTSDEVAKLQAEYPDDWEDWIRRLDMGKAMKGYQYVNDYAAIRTWIENEELEKTAAAFQELMAEWHG